jgi:hypothetical protein
MTQNKVEKFGVFLASRDHDHKNHVCHAFTTQSPRFYHHQTRKNRKTALQNSTFLSGLFFLLDNYLSFFGVLPIKK